MGQFVANGHLAMAIAISPWK